jgi:hypothetical protein
VAVAGVALPRALLAALLVLLVPPRPARLAHDPAPLRPVVPGTYCAGHQRQSRTVSRSELLPGSPRSRFG